MKVVKIPQEASLLGDKGIAPTPAKEVSDYALDSKLLPVTNCL